jgi:hypothetical protein
MNHFTLAVVMLFSYLLLVVSPTVINAEEEFLHQELTRRGLLSIKCGNNEKYVTCQSSSCFDETCESVNSDSERMCTEDCVVGCTCAPDYVRDPDGRCYPSSTCNDEDAYKAYQAAISGAYQGKNVGRKNSTLLVVLQVVLMKLAMF